MYGTGRTVRDGTYGAGRDRKATYCQEPCTTYTGPAKISSSDKIALKWNRKQKYLHKNYGYFYSFKETQFFLVHLNNIIEK